MALKALNSTLIALIEEILQEELLKTLQAICKSDSEMVKNLSERGFESIGRLNTLIAEVECKAVGNLFRQGKEE